MKQHSLYFSSKKCKFIEKETEALRCVVSLSNIKSRSCKLEALAPAQPSIAKVEEVAQETQIAVEVAVRTAARGSLDALASGQVKSLATGQVETPAVESAAETVKKPSVRFDDAKMNLLKLFLKLGPKIKSVTKKIILISFKKK